MSQNPYAGFGRVVVGDRLAGREAIVDEIVERLSGHNGSIAVIGNPRIGKTSLVRETMDRLERNNADVIMFSVDLSTIPNSLELFRAMNDELVSGCARRNQSAHKSIRHLAEAPVLSAYEAYRCARRMLALIAAAGTKTQMFVDEFDSIRGFEDAQSTIQRLRDLIYRSSETGLSAVFIARRALRTIELSLADVSTLDGVCEQHYLGPLDSHGLFQLADRASGAGWVVSADERELLEFHTGGHPFLAEMILCKGWYTRSVSEGVQRSVGEIFDFYEHIRRLLEEENFFDQLMQIAVGPRMAVRPGSVERLVRYGLIKKDVSQTDLRYVGWSKHFQLYLERCAKDTPLVSLWKETEISLRSYITSTFSSSLGETWITTLVNRHNHLRPIVDGCFERMAREQKNFGDQAEVSFIDYSYPMDLWQLIVAEWNTFRAHLGHTKDYWNQRFAHLAKVRTPTAHNREIIVPQHEIKLAEAYCNELLQKIEAAASGAGP